MKTIYTKEFIHANKGCYKAAQVEALPFNEEGLISIQAIFYAIPLKDFIYFISIKSMLSPEQHERLSYYITTNYFGVYGPFGSLQAKDRMFTLLEEFLNEEK